MIKEFIDNVNFYELAKFISLFKKDDSPYKILSYVRTDGRQYVNIGTPQGNPFYCECVFEFTEIFDRANAIFGTYTQDSSKSQLTFGVSNNKLRILGFTPADDNEYLWNGEPIINTVYNVKLYNMGEFNPPHTMIINSDRYDSYTGRSSFVVGNDPFYLFTRGPSTIHLSSIKLYSFKIGVGSLNDQDITCNLIPVKRKSDNKIGLYDTIRDQFYTSSSGYDLLYP